MFKLVLTIDGQERRALYVSYQYFRTLIPDDQLYRKFLQKNFPYEREDLFDLEPYEWCIPAIKATQQDIALMEKARINIALRKRTPIPDPQKQKEDYYTELTQLRYDARLDRGIIPNLRGLYHMEARPLERTTSTFNHHHLVGGVFTVTLEATPEDSLYYGWLISETSKTGEIIVYKNDEYTPEFRIKFADCYCTGIKGNLNGRTGMPMTITLELSPAIVENRGILVEKPWKEGALAASAPPEQPIEEIKAEESPENIEDLASPATTTNQKSITFVDGDFIEPKSWNSISLDNINLRDHQQELREMVSADAEMLRHKPFSERGPVVARARDTITGFTSDYKTNDVDLDLESLDPFIRERVINSLLDPQHFSTPGTHAEVKATSDVVKQRRKILGLGPDDPVPPEILDGIITDQYWLTEKVDKPNEGIQPAATCGNCTQILQGTESTAGYHLKDDKTIYYGVYNK